MPYLDAGRTWRHPPVPFRSEDGRLPKHLNRCNAPGFTIAGADGIMLQYTVKQKSEHNPTRDARR